MAAVQRTVNPRTKQEVWTARARGVRHDYRDCEAYQVIAAYLSNVQLLPEEAQLMIFKQQQAALSKPGPEGEKPGRDWVGTDTTKWV
jgi:hypothetical protein